MCGIVGFVGGNVENKEEVIEKMQERIKHRGPDGRSHYIDGDVVLGHVRLSIIDIEGGAQPMSNPAGDVTIVFNGEIYNYQELREELKSAGWTFQTNSDTEVLLRCYEAYGATGEMLNKLRGMFAFVIWDKKKQELFGARDFFGIKPFYYATMGKTFLFASEIKAFLDHPEFKKELNEERLPDYMTFNCLPGYDTMFKNVYKLAPGHFFTYKNGEMKITKYYNVEFHPDYSKSYEEFVDEISDTFHQSVLAHKIADVEVGCFLSSGVDSSYTAAELAKIYDVKTYTVGFADHKYSEADDAKVLADEIHVVNYPKIISADDYFGSFAAVQYQLDEPLGNPSANNLYHVCQRASEDVKCVLSGEGADEMFGGYNVYKEPLSLAGYQKIPRFIRKGIGAVAQKLPEFKGRNFLIRGSKTVAERYIGNSNVFKYEERDKYLKKHYDSKPPQYYTKAVYDKAEKEGYDDITQMQFMDIHGWMVREILLKADKMSMAHSLELRVPFLDKEIFALSNTIPTKFRVSKENTKLALRSAANREMNDESAKRKKLAFPTPLPAWIKEDKYYEIIKKQFTSEYAEKFFHTDMLVQLLDNHRNGERFMVSKIWNIYSFLVWYEQYFVLEP